jgi:hypothetical protein
MNKIKDLSWQILCISAILILFIFCNTLNASEKPMDAQDSINKWELDKLSLIKKRHILNLDRNDINNDSIIDLVNKFRYLNDYIVYSLISVEKVFQVDLSAEATKYLVSSGYGTDAFAKKEAISYFKDNIYANYAKEIMKLNTALEQCNDDKMKTSQVVGIAAATGVTAGSALAIASGTLSASAATGGLAGGAALLGGGAALATPVIAIAAPVVVAVGGLAGVYCIYKTIKKHGREGEFLPIIDKSLEFFKVPMNGAWKKAILAYLELQKDRDQQIHLLTLFNEIIQKNLDVIPGKVLEFREKIRNNEIDYYKYDAMLRYYLFDQPLQILMLMTNLKIDLAKGVLNDDETKIMSAGRIFGRCSRLIHYSSNQETRDLYTKTTKRIKKELNKNEYKEIDSIIQVSLDWLKEPSNMEIKTEY